MKTMWKIAGAAVGGAVATMAAGGIAFASMQGGMGPMGRADANGDGKVTRAEFVGAAEARFVRLDANGDGALVAAEMPRRKGGRGHGRRGDRDMAPPAPVAPVPAQ